MATEADTQPPGEGRKVWATLITKMDYVPGALTLHYSLKRAKTIYPFVALYTDGFPEEGLRALQARGISTQRVEYLQPAMHGDFPNDLRFHETWTKLTVFGLVQYDRVVLLDSDMLVIRNMDELMELELDHTQAGEPRRYTFAATHACVCNPLKRAHYPAQWIPNNCAFTSQHSDPEKAQAEGPPADSGIGMPNGGLLVLNPSVGIYNTILEALGDPKTLGYDFPDQELLGEVFRGQWLGLPYVYNALKSLRWPGVHSAIWRDDEVKNVHYIFWPKPWDMAVDCHHDDQELLQWWWAMDEERVKAEKDSDVAVGRKHSS